MRVLIVDDEAPARSRARRLLADLADIEAIFEASNGFEALEQAQIHRPHLILLDVQMPELDGFGVAHALDPSLDPSIVFLTAYDEYALRAFDVRALDYLLKPVEPERLARAVERARRERAHKDAAAMAASLTELKAQLPARKYLQRLFVQERRRTVALALDGVERIEAEQNYVRICGRDGEYLHRSTITALAAALDPEVFVRISRSTVVRRDAIREMRPCGHGDCDLLLQSGARVRWSRLYRARSPGRLSSD
jgi:two-component system LytT family response regulator